MTLQKFFVLALVFVSLSASASGLQDDIMGEGPAKYKNLFVVKTDKKFTGAKVEVISAHGDVLTSQNLQKRKMIIDFGSVQIGTYTIRVSKGDRIQEFQYVKK